VWGVRERIAYSEKQGHSYSHYAICVHIRTREEGGTPGRDLILPEIANVESISVQLETLRLNSVCTNNVIDSLIQMVSKLSEEVGLLRKDNEILKMKVGKLTRS
jgi:hypothetical protein